MRAIVLAVLLVLMATPASASLTAAEKAEVKRVYLAVKDITDSLQLLGQIMAGSTTTNRSTINLAMSNAFSALGDLRQGALDFMGYDSNTMIGQKYCPDKCRALSTYITTSALTGASGTITNLRANFTTLSSDPNPTIAALAAQAVTLLDTSTGAAFKINTVITNAAALDYAEPMPDYPGISDSDTKVFGARDLDDFTQEHDVLTAFSPSRNVVGPHGDYISVMNGLENGLTFLLSGMGSWQEAWNWVLGASTIYSTAEFTAFGQGLIRAAIMMEHAFQVLVQMADIPLTDAGCGKTPVRMMMDAWAQVMADTLGIGFHIFTFGTETFTTVNLAHAAAIRSNATFTDYLLAIQNMTLAQWSFTDGAFWRLLEFPVKRPRTLANFRSQFDRETTSHTAGSGMCADSTAPTVSVSTPTASSTISGMTTLRATATDNIGIRKVRWKIGATYYGQPDFVGPYEILWDTSEVSNGAKSLCAEAMDMNGNTTDACVSVTVSN